MELAKVFFGAALICAIPLFLRFAPAWAEQFYPVCIWNRLTDLYCPGCGTLRAFTALAHFDFGAAFRYNPFLFLLVLPLAVYLCVIYIIRAISGKWVPSLLSSHKAVIPAAAIIVGVWIFRNVFPPS
jgi:hypothetical protein